MSLSISTKEAPKCSLLLRTIVINEAMFGDERREPRMAVTYHQAHVQIDDNGYCRVWSILSMFWERFSITH